MSVVLRLIVGFSAGAVCSPAAVLLLRWTATTVLTWRRAVTVVVLSGGVGAGVALWERPLVSAGVAFLLLGVPIAVVDAIEHRIPDRLSLPLAALTVTALVVGTPGEWGRIVAGGGLCFGLLLLSYVLSGQPGPGDVKLAVSVGAVLGRLGWSWLLGGLVATYLLTALAGLVGVAAGRYRVRDGQVPMGPAMVAVVVAAGALASPCINAS
ncbi:prepilin peptidase [Amycolatopsis sp. RTGN1]|uniref:prepilin peptidase n=1 Tax=Amycolatopsis ponsaeliensis TaxID=2992142 RepID=UPI00254BA173|nr:prepilin peptidase [Amycolatopsis sp. RTGN1]